MLLKDATFINESYGDGQHRGNFLKWKRAAIYMRRLTQAIRPGKLINPVTCLVAKAKNSQSRIFDDTFLKMGNTFLDCESCKDWIPENRSVAKKRIGC